MSPQTDPFRRQLLDRSGTSPVEVVEALAGVNAQTPRGPSVGLWSRIEGFSQEEFDDDLRAYRLVKANLMRGTVHMVTARQFVTWRQALDRALRRAVRQFTPLHRRGIDVDAVVKSGVDLLAGSREGLTRADLKRHLDGRFDADPGHCAFAVRLLAPVVQVADSSVWRPGHTRYVLADSVLDMGAGSAADEDAGLNDLLAAYLRAFGPATAADATAWSGITALGPRLAALPGIEVNGSGASRTFDLPTRSSGARPAFVLPEFDNVFFAHTEGPVRAARRRLMHDRTSLMHGSVVHAGEVVASWRKLAGGDDLEVTAWESDLPPEAAEAVEEFRAFYARTCAT